MSLIRASLALFAMALVLTVALASCGGFGSSGLSTNGLPNITAQNSFRMVGIAGTPFSGIVSDFTSSWVVQGTVPLTIAIVNGQPPFRMIATKLSADNNLLSMEVLRAQKPGMLSSTSQPFGITSAQTGGTLLAIAPQAEPDVRFYIRAPQFVLMSGLIEDNSHSIAVEQRTPTLFLFEAPTGTIDGMFNEPTVTAGTMAIDLYYTLPPSGTVVCREFSTNNVLTIKFPGCTTTPLSTNQTTANQTTANQIDALAGNLLPLHPPD